MTMKKNIINRVVVAGGGTSGWLTAAAIAKLYGKQVEVTLVDSSSIGRIGVGEATIPPLRNFHRLIGIDEQEFMAKTKATFKLGIEFSGWGAVDDSYIHSFGITGKDCWACDFHHFWLAGRDKGIATDFGDYCIELQAACQSKIDREKLNYAYHLDAGMYAEFLRAHALRYGARHIDKKISEMEISEVDGSITALRLEDGERLEGDLFIDCTGFSALLIEGALNVGYESYRQVLPNDSAVAVQSASGGPLRPYTQAMAHEFGWQWRIPLQNRVGNGLVYCSRYVSDEDARERLLSGLETDAITETRMFRYHTGRRTAAWHKNCVAIGLSSGFLEPVESTSIHLAMSSILRLLKFFPRTQIEASSVEEFNRETQEEVERIRDFIILHYHATARDDSPYWRYCKQMDIPKSLSRRVQLFRDTGIFPIANKELFKIDSWVQVMLGQGVIPSEFHPIVDLMSDAELSSFLNGYKGFVARSVAGMPAHEDAINRYCAANLTAGERM